MRSTGLAARLRLDLATRLHGLLLVTLGPTSGNTTRLPKLTQSLFRRKGPQEYKTGVVLCFTNEMLACPTCTSSTGTRALPFRRWRTLSGVLLPITCPQRTSHGATTSLA